MGRAITGDDLDDWAVRLSRGLGVRRPIGCYAWDARRRRFVASPALIEELEAAARACEAMCDGLPAPAADKVRQAADAIRACYRDI